MADFCRACSLAIFERDFEELAGITKQEDWEKGMACTVLCEGCGAIQVDPQGNCVSENCFCEGEEGHGLPWLKEAP